MLRCSRFALRFGGLALSRGPRARYYVLRDLESAFAQRRRAMIGQFLDFSQELQQFDRSVRAMDCERFAENLEQFREFLERDRQRLNDLSNFYVIEYLECLVQHQHAEEFDFQRSLDTVYDIGFKNLGSLSFDGVMVLLSLSAQLRAEASARKMFRIFEYLVIRTEFVAKLDESQTATVVQVTDAFARLVPRDVTRDLLEKIEFVLLRNELENFALADLAVIAYVYQRQRLGTHPLVQLVRRRFAALQRQAAHREALTPEQAQHSLAVCCFLAANQLSAHDVLETDYKTLLANAAQKLTPYYLNIYAHCLEA